MKPMDDRKQSNGLIKRTIILGFVFLMVFSFLGLQLYRIQIIHGKRLAEVAFSQRAQKLPLQVPRGDILDRNLEPFTNQMKELSCCAFPVIIPAQQREDIAENLADILPLKQEMILEKLVKPVSPHVIYEPLTLKMQLEISSLDMPGVIVIDKRMRYGIPGMAHHVLGYLKEWNSQGVSGVEKSENSILQHQERENVVAMVDARRGIISGLGVRRQPANKEKERHVVLTLDKKIQQCVEQIMNRYISSGAVIVLKPQTGEILAMASRPDFQPEAPNFQEEDTEENGKLLNRGIRSFPLGSVFKVVVAAAALEEKIVDQEEKFFCPGYIKVGNRMIKCHEYKSGGHGKITFPEGMVHSCNVVFIELANRLGKERLMKYAQKFGFGEKTGIGLSEEMVARLPDISKMYCGDLANTAIGQGKIEVTPLQVAQMMEIVANNGVRVPLMLTKEVRDGEGTLIEKFNKRQSTRVISLDTAYAIQKMLVDVTLKGTGQHAQVKGTVVAGKTGTAQTGRRDEDGNEMTHAWFVGYAPAAQPKYVVAVFAENGGSGGGVAAPVFREIVERLLKVN